MQDRNDYIPSTKDFRLIVGERQLLNEADLDLKLAIIAMKYSVSNNIVIAAGNRTFAISAGQQSRILSTKIACSKFRQFRLLQHPEVIKTTSMTRGKITDRIIKALEFSNTLEIQDHLYQIPPVLTSDGFIPFTDNIDEAKKHGIKIVLEPEGALKGKDVAEAASSSGITLVRTEKRYFYH